MVYTFGTCLIISYIQTTGLLKDPAPLWPHLLVNKMGFPPLFLNYICHFLLCAFSQPGWNVRLSSVVPHPHRSCSTLVIFILLPYFIIVLLSINIFEDCGTGSRWMHKLSWVITVTEVVSECVGRIVGRDVCGCMCTPVCVVWESAPTKGLKIVGMCPCDILRLKACE